MKIAAKIVQGERNDKKQLADFFALPSRSLFYQKIVQGERNDKKNSLLIFCIAKPKPILSKSQCKVNEEKTNPFDFFYRTAARLI